MRLAAESSEVVECSGGESTAAAGEDGGAVVVVGVKVDTRSKELLTWALVKVAQTGDRVIALHVLNPNVEKSDLLSLVKTFDSMLAAYEGFCNLKQVDLKLKVCKGSPTHKIILREAKSCGATSLIVGTSGVDHKVRSRTSVAKYCAKNLQKNASVICVNNGKIVFATESNASCLLLLRGADVQRTRSRKKKLSKSPLSLPPQRLLTSSSDERENVSMALVPVKTREMPESKSGWTVLRKSFFNGLKLPESPSSKKSSVMRWMFRLPTRQSDAAIYPDQKQTSTSDTSECLTNLDPDEGAIVLYSVDNDSNLYSSKTFSEELNALTEKYSATCQLFSYQELLLATDNFIPENLIGKGGSSRVYRGCLPGGQEIAVKILKPTEDVLKQFVSEIEIISSVHHKNIISLVGFCFEEDKLLLVYNLLSRGSLEDNLHELGSEKSKNFFDWDTRYKVALGVAEALDYLHSSAEPIIHRDVKSSNILLSDDFEPQLSDFGLATWASSCLYHMRTSDVAGTFGYLAPEYFLNGKLDEKLDVYAFGVVLLELLTGRKPINDGSPKGKQSLVMWAKDILKEGKTSELQDPGLSFLTRRELPRFLFIKMSSVSMKIPLIDLSNLGKKDSPRWESTKIKIREALEEYGCFEATFNIIPLELRKSVSDGIRQHFDLPLATKQLNKISRKVFHGYVSQNDNGPLMESTGIDGALSSHVVDTFVNLMWPEGNPTFSKDFQLYCAKLAELDKLVRRMVVESLGLEKYIDKHINSTDYLCRFHKYDGPRTPHPSIGIKSHTDKNILTTLHQLNHVNGLEILTKDGKTWIPADPTSLDSFVVLVGGSFHAWTNGRLHAPIHRVVVSGDEARYSIGLFSVPKEGTVIKTSEELVNEDHPLLYKPFDYYKFLEFSYTDAGRASPDPLKVYCGA